MENSFFFYGAKFWAKVIAFFEIVWFSFFLGYFILKSFGVLGNTLLFAESAILGYVGMSDHKHENAGSELDGEYLATHEIRVSMLANSLIGLYFSFGLFMSLLLLFSVTHERTRYLKCWIIYAILKYMCTTILMLMDHGSLCDFIIYSVTLMFGTAFCISAVRTLLLEITHKQEQKQRLEPFRLSLDNVLVKFSNRSSNDSLFTKSTVPYHHL